jgi:hypothetical protein
LLEGDHATALRIMRAAEASARASGYAVREHITLIILALAAAVCGEAAEAEQALARARAHPMQAMCRWHQWVGGGVTAYAALLRGDAVGAEAAWRGALAIVRESGVRGGPALSAVPALLPRLTAFALARDIEPDIARDIVKRQALKAPPEADERWPWPVRVRAFGGLTVEVHGAPMPSSRKESRRLLELLRLLAAHGTRPLALDRVADALWPDADGDAARNALDNALHRLRKALGGDDRVVLHRGALALNRERCWSDVDAVERRLDGLSDLAIEALPEALRALQRLAVAPLLPDDEQALVAARRHAIGQRWRTGLEAAARRLQAAGQTEAAAQARQALDDAGGPRAA